MTRVCYIDCFSGVAGDMLMAALLDAGANLDELRKYLNTISEIKDEWNINLKSVLRSDGKISAKHLIVDSIYNHRPHSPPSSSSLNSIEHRVVDSNESTDDHDHSANSHIHDHSHQSNSHSHHHDHTHSHHGQSHDHSNESHSDDHSHVHTHDRGLTDIRRMINASELPESVKHVAINVFTELAQAEARVHGTNIENVHFHEVGAIDSIIDTVGVVLALYLLEIDQVYCSALPLSKGTVWTAHGLLPVPAPAALLLMQDMVLTAGPKGITGELVTPTGASLIRVLCGLPTLLQSPTDGDSSSSGSRQGHFPFTDFRLMKCGVGAGTKDFAKHPNILRVLIGELNTSTPKHQTTGVNISASLFPSQIKISPSRHSNDIAINSAIISHKEECSGLDVHINHSTKECSDGRLRWDVEKMVLIETNIDDMTPEIVSFVTDKLLSKGANDVWTENIYMKKGRAAVKLSVLCSPSLRNDVLEVMFKESSSIGVRIHHVDRASLRRSMITLMTSYGPVQAKVAYLDEVIVTVKPEFEDCKSLAVSLGIPLKDVMSDALDAVSKYRKSCSE